MPKHDGLHTKEDKKVNKANKFVNAKVVRGINHIGT
jgi:hypothetical protein